MRIVPCGVAALEPRPKHDSLLAEQCKVAFRYPNIACQNHRPSRRTTCATAPRVAPWVRLFPRQVLPKWKSRIFRRRTHPVTNTVCSLNANRATAHYHVTDENHDKQH